MGSIDYTDEEPIDTDQFIDLLHRSGLAQRRPVDDRHCMASMVHNADILMTAWRGDALVGVARSVTDFTYCCYLSDLAVDSAVQRQGVGRALIDHTRSRLAASCRLVLLSAPQAADYYPHLGFDRHESCWTLAAAARAD